MISIKLFALGAPFKYLTIRIRFTSSLSVGHVIFLAVSLHSVYDVCSFLAHVQTVSPQLFCTLFVFRLPAQRVILSLASSSHSESSRVLLLPNQEHLSRFGCTSDSLPPSILVPFARSLCPRNKICHLSSLFFLRFSSKLVLTRVQSVSELHFSVQRLTRHQHERKYLCSSHRYFQKQLGSVKSG